jgi:hypothetical protein
MEYLATNSLAACCADIVQTPLRREHPSSTLAVASDMRNGSEDSLRSGSAADLSR